jgi:hypothetical protein
MRYQGSECTWLTPAAGVFAKAIGVNGVELSRWAAGVYGFPNERHNLFLGTDSWCLYSDKKEHPLELFNQ